MTDKSFYEVLGVPPDATPDEIKKAWKGKVHKTHPDKPGGDEDVHKQLVAAYSALSDPAARERYDRTGSAEEEPVKRDPVQESLRAMAAHLLTSADYDGMDLIGAGLALCDETMREQHNSVLKMQKARDKLAKKVGRIQVDGEANIFDAVIAEKLAAMNKAIEDQQKEHDLCFEVRKRLQAYKDTQPVPISGNKRSFFRDKTGSYL